MVAGCGNNMLKYILLFLNFLVFLLSLVGVVASLVFIVKPGFLDKAGDSIDKLGDLNETLSPGTIKVGLYVILGASVVVLIISFLGCCGAWKEIKFLLGMYATIMLLILIAEVAAFVVAIVFKKKLEKGLKDALTKARAKNETIYGDFEKTLDCCGVNNNDKCSRTNFAPNVKAPTIGCYDKIIELIKKFYTLVMVISIVTVIIEVFLITFACCLCSNIGENVA